jgi:hypothetical protein
MNRRSFCTRAVHSALAAGFATSMSPALFAALTEVKGDLEAVTVDGQEITLGRSSVQALKDSLRGVLLLPGNDGYDHARAVWNAMIDRKPALIARCEGPADVSQALTYASEHNLLVAVRGGGHSISGKSVCEGGMMIDLSQMNSVRVDPAARTAWADGGCLEGHIDREAAMVGMGTTGGIVSHTGAGGLTTGGGFGRVCRKYGLTCDNLIAADLIAPDGNLYRASEDENPELLWALQGGGGNFGVVTGLKYRLYPMDRNVIAGDLVFAWKDARDVLNYYGQEGNDFDDSLNMNVLVGTNPEGERFVRAEAVWSGDPDRFDSVIAPMKRVATPVSDNISSVPYVSFQKRGDNSNRHGVRMYMKSSFVEDFSEDLTSEIIEVYEPNPIGAIFIMQSSGAVNRIASDATAFPHRSAHSNLMHWNQWFDLESPDEREQRIASIRSNWARLEPYTQGFYVNLNDDTEKKTYSNYGDNYPRLVGVKNRFDPDNLLRMNANIQPSA